MKKIFIGLSGGVDSSVAAYLLKKQGYDVEALFMKNWHDTTGLLKGDCPWDNDMMFAEMVANKLDIPFHHVDLSKEYRKHVIDYMTLLIVSISFVRIGNSIVGINPSFWNTWFK